eukprot:294605-Pyramimonas_sp.AAC.1
MVEFRETDSYPTNIMRNVRRDWKPAVNRQPWLPRYATGNRPAVHRQQTRNSQSFLAKYMDSMRARQSRIPRARARARFHGGDGGGRKSEEEKE